MANLIINRINLRFNQNVSCPIHISKRTGFWLVGGTLTWVKKKLPSRCIPGFEDWLLKKGINEEDSVSFKFHEGVVEDSFSVRLKPEELKEFRTKIFIQELASFFIENGFYIETLRKTVDFSAYQRIGDFDQEYERYRRIDFKWKWKREELSCNIGSESSLIKRQKEIPQENAKIVNESTQLIYNSKFDSENTSPRKSFPLTRINQGTPRKFNYKDRYKALRNIAQEYLNSFQSQFFNIDKSGMKTVAPRDRQEIFRRQNLMAFGGGKTSVNAALGMREFGPFKKIANANKVKLLFIYKDRDDANNLYQYLRNGLKHFPGLLSYTGIPVSLPGHKKGLRYGNPVNLIEELRIFLSSEYPDRIYPETLAIIIGPFNKHESDEEESETYYEVKKLLLEKGISSQFINSDTIKKSNFQYALPNIAIAILSKFGGIPWRLATKRHNELIVGFNVINYLEDKFLGSAVFFDNEGKLGSVHGFPQSDSRGLIRLLKNAINEFTGEYGDPDRLVIHYYKPPKGRKYGESKTY